MVWDNAWFGGGGTWARANDTSPANFRQSELVTGVEAASGRAPVVKWTNPTGRSIDVNVSGQLQTAWYNDTPLVDVVLAKYSASSGTYTPLKTWNDLNYFVTFNAPQPVSLSHVDLAPGDSLVWSLHRNAGGTYWTYLYDSGLNITLNNFNTTGISNVGGQTSQTGPNLGGIRDYRTTTVPKPFDVDGDNVYGSDGYVFWGTTGATNPNWPVGSPDGHTLVQWPSYLVASVFPPGFRSRSLTVPGLGCTG